MTTATVDDGDFIREHDDHVPTAQWHDGQLMPPASKLSSRRAQS